MNSSSKQPNYFLGCALSNKNQNYFIAPKHCYHNRTMTEQSHNSVDIVRVMVLILTFVNPPLIIGQTSPLTQQASSIQEA